MNSSTCPIPLTEGIMYENVPEEDAIQPLAPPLHMMVFHPGNSRDGYQVRESVGNWHIHGKKGLEEVSQRRV